MKDWLTILLFTDAFLLLFVVADLMYRRNILMPDHTRNVVHVGSGLLALLFPLFFKDVIPVAILCSSFLLLLIATKKLGLLGAVNAVKRKTYGSILYPVIVFLAFYFYSIAANDRRFLTGPFQPEVYYFLPIAILAIADPVAALFGNYFKASSNQGSKKTLYGSLAFSATAFLLSVTIITAQNNHLATLQILETSLIIAVLTAVAEYHSKNGWDNFTVPAVAIVILFFT